MKVDEEIETRRGQMIRKRRCTGLEDGRKGGNMGGKRK